MHSPGCHDDRGGSREVGGGKHLGVMRFGCHGDYSGMAWRKMRGGEWGSVVGRPTWCHPLYACHECGCGSVYFSLWWAEGIFFKITVRAEEVNYANSVCVSVWVLVSGSCISESYRWEPLHAAMSCSRTYLCMLYTGNSGIGSLTPGHFIWSLYNTYEDVEYRVFCVVSTDFIWTQMHSSLVLGWLNKQVSFLL